MVPQCWRSPTVGLTALPVIPVLLSVEHLFEYGVAMDNSIRTAIDRIDNRIATLTMQIKRLAPRSPSRAEYSGELIGLREARAFVLGEPAP
jgi:hypothetical protein